MEEFIKRSGEFSHVTVAVVSFFLGILATVVGETIKRSREKNRLIDLFIQDIWRNWREVDSLKGSPVGPFFSRLRLDLKGVGDVIFSGIPEYMFEVYNLKFFETEGIKLAQMLPAIPRKSLWDAYSIMRDAEAVRGVLNKLSSTDSNYASYQKLFVTLVGNLRDCLLELEKGLRHERSWWAKLLLGPRR